MYETNPIAENFAMSSNNFAIHPNLDHFHLPTPPPMYYNVATTTTPSTNFSLSPSMPPAVIDSFSSQFSPHHTEYASQFLSLPPAATAQQQPTNYSSSNEMTQISNQLTIERNQNQDLQTKLASQNSEINELRLTIDNMNRQAFSQSTMQIAPLQAELQSQLQTIGILIGEKNDLNANLLKFQQQTKEKSDEIDELQGRLNASRHRVQTLEKEIGQIKSSHSKYDDSQQKLCSELEATQEEIRMLKKSNDELVEEVAELRQKLLLKSQNNDELRIEIGNLKTELNLSQLRVEQFSAGDYIHVDNKIEKLMQEKSIVEHQVNELQALVQQLGLERDQSSLQYQNYVQHLNKESANFAHQVQELAADNERLSKREAGLTKHVGELERQIQQQLAKQKSLQDAKDEETEASPISTENASLAELTKKCEDLESSRNALWVSMLKCISRDFLIFNNLKI